MTQEYNYRKGDKVLYKTQAPNGPLWEVVEVDFIKQRCQIKRTENNRTIKRSSAFSVLMLEVDLPRRQAPEPKPNRKHENPQNKYLDKGNSLILTFERIAKIIHLVNDSEDIVDNNMINEKIMPGATPRTVQRHTEALCDGGYLKSIILEKHRQGFYITDKARDLLNLHERTTDENKTDDAP